MDIKSQILDVTPDLATKWLEGNTHNRPLRHGTVEKYSETMRAKKWRLTHQGIAFDEKGVLIDGQHRLYAIFNSGITVKMMVTHGLSMDTQLVIDDHAKRSALDVGVVQEGLSNLSSRHVAAARIMYIYGLGNHTSSVTNQRMVEFLKTYFDGIHFAVTDAFKNTVKRGITQAGIIGVVAQAYYSQEHGRLREFGEVMLTGIPKGSEDLAAILLARWLLESTSLARGASNQKIVYGKTQRALLSFIQREHLGRLYESKDQLFPLPGVTAAKKMKAVKGKKA